MVMSRFIATDPAEFVFDAPIEPDEVQKFNPHHAPAGSPTGGQFTSASGEDSAAFTAFQAALTPIERALPRHERRRLYREFQAKPEHFFSGFKRAFTWIRDYTIEAARAAANYANDTLLRTYVKAAVGATAFAVLQERLESKGVPVDHILEHLFIEAPHILHAVETFAEVHGPAIARDRPRAGSSRRVAAALSCQSARPACRKACGI
jgi:hypothetical protein